MTPAPPSTKREQTRARLLDAAVRVLQEGDQGRMSVNEVARAAGLTSGAVQHHYPTKSALMLDVISRLIAELEATTDFWPPSDWPLARRADHFVDQAWSRLYGQPRFATAWAAYLSVRNDSSAVAHIIERRTRLTGLLQKRLAACFPELCDGPDGVARAQLVLSALRGMGLVAPFSPPAAIGPQLRQLSAWIQRFKNEDT